MLTMSKVKSSSIAEIGHDGAAMHVKFASGQTYTYPNVSAETMDLIMAAESPGKQFHASITSRGIKHAKRP